jgi:hypothetical protein
MLSKVTFNDDLTALNAMTNDTAMEMNQYLILNVMTFFQRLSILLCDEQSNCSNDDLKLFLFIIFSR